MKEPLPIVFMGTGGFSVPILQSLHDHYQVIAVVTQPDRPKGRGRVLATPAAKQRALELGLPVLQPERIKDTTSVDQIRSLHPRWIVVAAYGQIVPGTLLRVPEMGCVNVHASLLPRYRGAAPIAWAIANGDSTTGVTTMMMDEGMDTGPILLSRVVSIDPKDTAASLESRLAAVGADLVVETIRGLERGELRPTPQDWGQATVAPSFKKEDGEIDWSQPARVLHDRIRAFNPWPSAFTHFGSKILKIFWAEVDETLQSQPPGCVVGVERDGIWVATGKGHIVLKEIQLEGKKRLPVREFLLGQRVDAGTILGSE